MTSMSLSLSRFGALATLAVLSVGTALAQAPEERSSRGSSQLRQPTRASDQQADADKSGSEADRKVREMDRKLARTLRSVCVGC